ncbi:hypothetical protein N7468_003263 [Penicillium chermesinum]|uniref:Uncharacterized protein n=1 Tax=Penicillium chermesinum TaxID=63820 RepID=A0A9W9TT75_9EURO|nr:uncharacterized protein N7468_003263 [Penicillium chermesinum]KAJ5238644.1 hypothetical protein N7468_003263 [Penicillium chermesinum]
MGFEWWRSLQHQLSSALWDQGGRLGIRAAQRAGAVNRIRNLPDQEYGALRSSTLPGILWVCCACTGASPRYCDSQPYVSHATTPLTARTEPLNRPHYPR